MKRLLTAAVLIPFALAGVFLLPEVLFFWGIGMVVLAATWELAEMARHWAPSLDRITLLLAVTALAIVLVPVSSGLAGLQGWTFALVVVGLLACGGLGLTGKVLAGDVLPYVGALAFGSLYLGVPWASMGVLKSHGAPWVFLLLASVWLSDSGAYYTGRAFGRRKLAPTVSPNKTWEGSIGGAIAALVGAVGWSFWQYGTIEPLLLGWVLVVAIAGQIGDLFESKLKRGAGVKDSGNLLPGHGGMLDRIDGILFAAPLMALALEYCGLAALGR